MNINRRNFIFGSGAFALAAGCRSTALFGKSDLVFGVISDIHVTTPGSCAMFEKALRYFRGRGVDAVMAPGDLTDWGTRSSLVYLKETWDKVFGGTETVPLFCTGNHEYDGWWYGDMTMEMHATGYSEDEAMSKLGMGKCWEEVLGEKFAPVRRRTVKGYDFVSCEWGAFGGVGDWMEKNGESLKGDKPFFYFQHPPIDGTTSDSSRGSGGKKSVRAALDRFPNCIAFTGHTHRPFIDERSIWQGTFTAVATPSLSYAGIPAAYENGSGNRLGKSKKAMQVVPYRRELRGGQGYVVNVWEDKIAIERVDLEEEASDAPEWVIPLPACRSAAKPFDNAVRAKTEPVPEFPCGAALTVDTRNTENRSGHWVIVMNCVFPSAKMPSGSRVFDYEIKAVPKDGSAPVVKRFVSPAFAKMAKFEPAMQRFWFDVAELPQDKEYVLEVRARNCFGVSSAPLVSKTFKGKPGLDKAVRG